MTEAGGSRLPLLRRGGATEQRLVVLMGARLALVALSLGIALALDTAVGDASGAERRGLYGTVAFAFLATAFYGLVLPRVQRRQALAASSIAADIGIVSALVHFSGGPDSVFAFLYLLVAAYGALLFDRRGALVTTCLGALAYGAVLTLAWLGVGGGVPPPATILVTLWAVNGGAIALVAALSSFLALELQRTGEALRQRTSDLRDLAQLHARTVESLMSGLLTVDPRGRVTSFNPEAERITGRRVDDALGLDVEQVLPGIREAGIARTHTGRSPSRERMSFRDADGQDLHLGVAAYILRDSEGRPSGHVVIFQDVTAVVEMEEELRHSERLAAVGELSASIAHEVRNPLAAISGSIQILQRLAGRPETGAEAERLMRIVVRETERLDRLITDFLQYARPGPPQLEAVPLRGLLDELSEMLSAALPEAVRLEAEAPPGLFVEADPGQLRQILWNLALNGGQAMPEGGTLALTAAPLDAPSQGLSRGGRNAQEAAEKGSGPAWVEIAVRDEGIGISAEARERVFEPFFTTKAGGTGLGLATVHRIVHEHGGSIRLESEEGRGTVFRIRLPRAEEPA